VPTRRRAQIARIAITQRGLLKQMGFIQSHGKGDEEIVDENVNGVAPAAGPFPTSPVGAHH
jgi:hypothetical protein